MKNVETASPRPRNRLRPGVIALGVLTTTAAALTAPTAVAGDQHWGWARPDGARHSYCYSRGVPNHLRKHMARAMSTLHRKIPRISVARHAGCTVRGSGQTDVQWIKDDTMGRSVAGSTGCVRKWGSGRCDRFRVRLNRKAMRARADRGGFSRALQYRKTACHELAHTAGQGHNTGAVDCTMTGAATRPQYPRTYGRHTVGDINRNYGR